MADATTESYKVRRSSPHPSKGHKLPQQMESALTFLICGCSVISPVQFIVQVNSKVLDVDVTMSYRQYGVESTGEIKEHNPHSASRLFQVRH